MESSKSRLDWPPQGLFPPGEPHGPPLLLSFQFMKLQIPILFGLLSLNSLLFNLYLNKYRKIKYERRNNK